MIKKVVKRLESKLNYLKISASNIEYYFNKAHVKLYIMENIRMEKKLDIGRRYQLILIQKCKLKIFKLVEVVNTMKKLG